MEKITKRTECKEKGGKQIPRLLSRKAKMSLYYFVHKKMSCRL